MKTGGLLAAGAGTGVACLRTLGIPYKVPNICLKRSSLPVGFITLIAYGSERTWWTVVDLTLTAPPKLTTLHQSSHTRYPSNKENRDAKSLKFSQLSNVSFKNGPERRTIAQCRSLFLCESTYKIKIFCSKKRNAINRLVRIASNMPPFI
jgi:hypothetical protein